MSLEPHNCLVLTKFVFPFAQDQLVTNWLVFDCVTFTLSKLFFFLSRILLVETRLFVDMLIIPSFLISSPSLKFTIFLYFSPIGPASTLLILAVCRTRVTTNSVTLTYAHLAHHESPSSSVVRASDRCTEGHRKWKRSFGHKDRKPHLTVSRL